MKKAADPERIDGHDWLTVGASILTISWSYIVDIVILDPAMYIY